MSKSFQVPCLALALALGACAQHSPEFVIRPAQIDSNSHGVVLLGFKPKGPAMFVEPTEAARLAGMLLRGAEMMDAVPGYARAPYGPAALHGAFSAGKASMDSAPVVVDREASERARRRE